ncbi:acyl-CoA N-acyltransferase [Meira miltonrushii]|uniref:N-alpha-acetyltransferase 40 n=1 Tax=Meira miltonrushii TaxID=1280837 RepID=A0A316VKT1_9BASI|nr:acyl-CoA N-acyltransferase [Meira miltonrushii]PWN36671.1 acyl-CoA N-acyltransferase [Meira miltonrushii]
MPIKTARQNVDIANKLSSKDLLRLSNSNPDEGSDGHDDEYSILTSKGQSFNCKAYQSQELEEHDRKMMMTIFEENMRTMYEETPGGWDAQSKKEELFDNLSRFFIIRQANQDNAAIIAFIMWRFDLEDCDANDPVARKGKRKIEIAYCYEIQVHSDFRQYGLGKWMMNRLEAVARNTNMRKVMLTVFKSNTHAKQFYDRLGFKLEYSTPENEDELDELGEYVILGKATM